MAGIYRGFKIRDRWIGALASGIQMLSDREGFFQRALQNAGARASEGFRGITANGTLEPHLYSFHGRGDDTTPVRRRAIEFLERLSEEQRLAALRPIDSPEWGRWSNAFEAPHGVSLLTLSPDQRESALAIVEATLSQRGFQTARNAMRLNETLGELVGNTELLGEWNYAMHIYGFPAEDQPWGWQLHGHHLIVSCFLQGNQIVLTPTFVGAEPTIADEGRYAGVSILQEEESAGLRFLSSLTSIQQAEAILYDSIRWADLPPERVHPADGRHQTGAFRDNAVVPYEGLPGSRLAFEQQRTLLEAIEIFVGRMSPGHANVKMDEVRQHLPRTHFVWMGGSDAVSPFYYRIQSPVILIEFDHHHGVFLDNDEPQRFHTHTIVRTPNGNDYGRDLLRQHLKQSHGLSSADARDEEAPT